MRIHLQMTHASESPAVCYVSERITEESPQTVLSPWCPEFMHKSGTTHQIPTFSVFCLFLTGSLSSSCDKHALTRYYVKPISPVFISRYVHATLPWPPKNPTSNQRATNTVENLLNCAIEMSAAEKRGKMDEEEGTRKGRKESKKKVGMKLDLVRSVV